jgi:hypothetical protein
MAHFKIGHDLGYTWKGVKWTARKFENRTRDHLLLTGALTQQHQKRNSMAFSPQANYADWTTATGRRILVATFADRGVSRDHRSGTPAAVNLSFLGRMKNELRDT